MKTFVTVVSTVFLLAVFACTNGISSPPAKTSSTGGGLTPGSVRLYSAVSKGYVMSEKIIKTDEEWKKQLTPQQFHVAREQGTEQAFTGETWNNHDKGIYHCVCCGNDLFSSEHKYESGTGWPSFWRPIAPENVTSRSDNSLFATRTEIVCSRCDAHLGHVFDDGPKPTGLRYCMNSAAMKFEKKP